MEQNRKVMDAVGIVGVGRVGFTETYACIFKQMATMPIGGGIVHRNSPYWEQTLTRLVDDGLATGSKYLLFLDGDSVWDPSDAWDLYKIIDADPDMDSVFPVQADRYGDKPLVYDWLPDLFGNKGKDGKLSYDFSKPVIKYPHGHMGLTFIRAEVFKQLPKPWFLSQPANDGTWDLKPGKMDADTYFWMKLRQHQQNTGHYCCLATQTVLGHMELHIRWQRGPEVVIQTLPDYQMNGKPYGCRAPVQSEYPEEKKNDREPEGNSGPCESDIERITDAMSKNLAGAA